MKFHISLHPFSKENTNFLKGVSILLIALHNYYRWVNPVTGENEFWFSTACYLKSFITVRSNPLEIFNVFFNFLGFYGVQGFILISAYGLPTGTNARDTENLSRNGSTSSIPPSSSRRFFWWHS
jgi:hypothetical protein